MPHEAEAGIDFKGLEASKEVLEDENIDKGVGGETRHWLSTWI